MELQNKQTNRYELNDENKGQLVVITEELAETKSNKSKKPKTTEEQKTDDIAQKKLREDKEMQLFLDSKIIYRHYATLFFVFIVDQSESELGTLPFSFFSFLFVACLCVFWL